MTATIHHLAPATGAHASTSQGVERGTDVATSAREHTAATAAAAPRPAHSNPLDPAVRVLANHARLQAMRDACGDQAAYRRLLTVQGELFLLAGLLLMTDGGEA